MFEAGQLVANGEKRDGLVSACDNNYSGFGMVEDVGHTVVRFLEINRNRNGAVAIDGEVGSVPLRTIGAEKTDAVTGFHTQLKKSLRESCSAAQKFLAGNGLPAVCGAEHLSAGTRPSVHRMQHLGGECAVAHASVPPLVGEHLN